MAIVETLAVSVIARTSKFGKGMKGAQRQLGAFGASVASTGRSLIGFGSLALAGVAGGGLAYLTKQSMESIDATTKLGSRINASTEGLVGLQHAASMSGSSSEELTKALEKQTRTIGEAASGTGEGVEAFKMLGLSVAELQTMKADDSFKLIADRINALPNAALKASAAADIFGRSGVNLLNTIAEGSVGLNKFTDDARLLGLTFDEVAGNQVMMANDAFDRLKKVFVGVGNQIAINLAPYVTFLADKLTDVATSGAGMGPKVTTAFGMVAKGAAKVADMARIVQVGFKFMQAGAMASIGWIVNGWGVMADAIVSVINLLPGVEIKFNNMLTAIGSDLMATSIKLADEAAAAWAEPWPSDKVGDFFKGIIADSKMAAKKMAADAAAMSGAKGPLETAAKASAPGE